MRIKSFMRIAAALIAVSLIAVPSFAARGTADFSRFVALGDSYGAGVVNGSMNERHQPYSWPAVIARQTGATFIQPTVTFPGIGPELQLVDVISYPPVIRPADGSGVPTNTTYPAPYNNLSIPGATVADLTKITGAEANPTRTPEQFARFILRGQGTAVDQAIALKPTFIAIFIGGNDLLGAVAAGTPLALTSADAFRTSYAAMLDRLVAGAPNAGMIVGTFPTNLSVVPLANTVAPVLINPATRQPALGPDGKPIYFVAELGDGTVGQLSAGDRVLLTASGRIATGYGLPAALKPLFPTLPDVGKPLPNTDVLTKAEAAVIEARAVEFNSIVTQLAQQRNIAVADTAGFFNRVATGAYPVGPFTFTSAFITGGIFSFDGFHLTDIGYTLLANQFIRGINQAYDTDIPVASLTQFFQNNGAFFGSTTTSGAVFVEGTPWLLSEEAAAQILTFATKPAAPRRLRIVNH